jgi:hypothetical protein
VVSESEPARLGLYVLDMYRHGRVKSGNSQGPGVGSMVEFVFLGRVGKLLFSNDVCIDSVRNKQLESLSATSPSLPSPATLAKSTSSSRKADRLIDVHQMDIEV